MIGNRVEVCYLCIYGRMLVHLVHKCQRLEFRPSVIRQTYLNTYNTTIIHNSQDEHKLDTRNVARNYKYEMKQLHTTLK